MSDLELLLNKHRTLDYIVEKANKNVFLSDWNCIHPFYKEQFLEKKFRKIDIQGYNYIRADDHLTNMISSFHKQVDGVSYTSDEILTGHGSTNLISSFFIWLSLKKTKQIYYIPPIYFTFHYFAKLYGIDLRPISKSQLFENKYSLNFPRTQSILILSDPIWYAGVSLSAAIYNDMIQWQKSTNSTVVIDGSFQYLKWSDQRKENASLLDKKNTFQFICPTKALAVHGFRFSYLLVPEENYDPLDYILDNLTGSSSAYDIRSAKICMKILSSKKANTELIEYTKSLYENLLQREIILEAIQPNCGYFVFAKLPPTIRHKFHVMDGHYFEQKRFPDYVRVNLLGNAVTKLLKI